ncbi:ATP phosphoribosyltransferase [candidate division KSB1 bacterium]|nr:ATP phosphoribosyltransferase [candidate division KSB1 bacterium]
MKSLTHCGDDVLKMGLPKGSLQDATFRLLAKAGYHFSVSNRSYFPSIEDDRIQAILIRAQEIARYVQDGVFDVGLTGKDWILENRAEVVEIGSLSYSKTTMRPVRWVLAVPIDSDIKSLNDLKGKRIATEIVNLTTDWLRDKGIVADVEFSWGATEVKAPTLVDAIVEVTETGSSLRANNLRIVETLLESHTMLIANRNSWQNSAKREKIENLYLMLQAAIDSEGKVGIKMNVPKDKLDTIMATLPAMKKPTISPLYGSDWMAVEIIANEAVVRDLIPALKRAGAQDIIEYPLNKVIH